MKSELKGESEYSDSKLERKEHGAIVLDGIQVASTKMCPHCGAHYVSRKGSRIKRTFCFHCGEATCGRAECETCVPLEKWLETVERNWAKLNSSIGLTNGC